LFPATKEDVAVEKDLDIAYRCAPVIVQKVNDDNPRGDFIARVDFTDPGNLASLTRNWGAVNDPVKGEAQWKEILDKKRVPPFTHKLLPHVYYSVVETHTHYFIMYAVYHPQDWESSETPWRRNGPKWKLTEHEHDMEGALVIAANRGPIEKLRPDAMITISHWWFYSYANWKIADEDRKEKLLYGGRWARENRYTGSRVNKENLDGNLWAIWHVDEEGEEVIRPKLYVQAKGHGIRGDQEKWGGGDRIIRYCPSREKADEPSLFEAGSPKPRVQLYHKFSLKGNKRKLVKKDVYRYKLINVFEPGQGLWANKNNRKVFLVDDKGQDCFVAHEDAGVEKLVPGKAKPPWSWDDCDDAHADGELALQPAHIVYNYLGGMREFSFEYKRNAYLGI
jgi:hypothetical protein